MPTIVRTEPATPGTSSLEVRQLVGWSALIVGLAWIVQPVAPTPGLDPGWITGLTLARELGLSHGEEVVFTYGPNGWLAYPLSIDSTGAWGHLVFSSLVLGLSTFVVLYAASLRYEPLVAVGAAYAVMAATPFPLKSEMVMIASFVVAMLTLQKLVPERLASWVPPAIAAAGGLQVTVKFGTGLITVGIALGVAVLGAEQARAAISRLLLAVAIATTVLVAAWALSGSPLGSLASYLGHSMEVSTGYVEMGTDSASVLWEYFVAAGLVFALVVLVVKHSAREQSLLSRLGWQGLLAGMVWHMFRYGFIRHDRHWLAFLWLMAICGLVVRWRPEAGRRPLIFSAVSILMISVGMNIPITNLLDPSDNLRAAAFDVQLAVSPSARGEMIDQRRQNAVNEYRVPEELLATVGDRSIHLDTVQTTLAWTYDLNWHPAPIFQPFVAYSPSLDRLNAEAIRAGTGPELILRRDESAIDGRYRIFDSPEYTYAMFCNFSSVLTAETWQLLERTANRCGEPRSVATVNAAAGEPVAVPDPTTPDAAIFARIDVSRSWFTPVRSFLFKPSDTDIVLDGRPFRIVSTHPSGPLLLNIPDQDDLPLRRLRIDGSNVLEVAIDGGGVRDIVVEFFEVPVGSLGGS